MDGLRYKLSYSLIILTIVLQLITSATFIIIGLLYATNETVMLRKASELSSELQELWSRHSTLVRTYFALPGFGLFSYGLVQFTLCMALCISVFRCGKVMRILCFVCIIIMILSHVTLIVMYFQNKTVFLGTSMLLLRYHFSNYVSMDNGDSVSMFTADTMKLFQCCGYSNGTDFGGPEAKFAKTDVYNGTVYEDLKNPLPCCKTTESGAFFPSCPNRFDTQNSNIRNGCQKLFMGLMERWIDFFVYLSIFALFINLISTGPIITA